MADSYRVMVDCCKSGNCVICRNLPVGTPVRLPLTGDVLTLERAEWMASYLTEYHATVEPAPEEEANA